MKDGRQGGTLRNRLRELPPVCLLAAVCRLLSGRLRLTRERADEVFATGGGFFRPFRRIIDTKAEAGEKTCVFSVRFRFSRLTEPQNRLASILPMLFIAGHPGFRCKVYSSDAESGRWMGLYEWASLGRLEAYRRSPVYRVMKKRAVGGTVFETIHPESDIDGVIRLWSEEAQ